MQDSLRLLLHHILSSYFVQQLAPILFLLLVPLIVLTASTHRSVLSWLPRMVFENLGSIFAWNWPHENGTSSSSSVKRKSKKKKHVRTRSEQQLAQNGNAVHGAHDHSDDVDEEEDEEGHYPGLVNISGTYCFMNSVLQAMASLSYLHPYIEAIHSRAEELDVPTPVIDALRDALRALNTPRSSPSSLRPTPMINALSSPSPEKRSGLFSSREHQDAQELFQLLSECIKSESSAVDREGHRDRGLGGLTSIGGQPNGEAGKSVFDGLTANRRSCVECGYTEAVMHFAFDNWQLAVPRMAGACTLQDCLTDYIRLELLTDCICRKCSMLATHRRLLQEAEKLSESVSVDSSASQSKKKRAREARRLEARVKAALDEGRIEEDLKGIKMEKVFSRASTKQAMIARPPRVLALHLNRSVHYGNYVSKNTCRILFPELLDLTPYTTSGQLSTVPSVPISTPPPAIPRSTTPTPSTYATPRVLYRLAAVVCHYGQHSFGHYVCFRRKPRPSLSAHGPSPIPQPKLACPLGCECGECARYGPVRDDKPPQAGRGWLRISDEAVAECGVERVQAEGAGAFMLFYERIVHPRPSVYAMTGSPRSSEETVRPDLVNGSSWSVSTVRADANGVLADTAERIVGPRVVRSAAAGRSRSASVAASERPASEGPTVLPDGEKPAESEPSPTPDKATVPPADEQPKKTVPQVPPEAHLSKPRSTASRLSEESLHAPTPLSPSRKLRPLETHKTRTASSSPSPSRKTSQTRIKSPQPLRPHLGSTNTPVRLGLYA